MNMKHIDPLDLHPQIGHITPASDSVLINVCTEAEFAEEHIANSVNIPLDKLTSTLPIFNGKKVVYVHCRSGKRSAKAVQILSQLDNVVVVDVRGGLLAWKEKGLATVQAQGRLPIMQQVFIAASMLIWIGLIGAYFVHSAFLILNLLVATGFLLSGITGWCGMAYLLSRMPWNRKKH